MKKANPEAGFGELGKLLGQKWATFSDKVRLFFVAPSSCIPLSTIHLSTSPLRPHSHPLTTALLVVWVPQDKEKYVKQSEAKKAAL